MTKYVQSRLLQNCRMRERFNKLFIELYNPTTKRYLRKQWWNYQNSNDGDVIMYKLPSKAVTIMIYWLEEWMDNFLLFNLQPFPHNIFNYYIFISRDCSYFRENVTKVVCSRFVRVTKERVKTQDGNFCLKHLYFYFNSISSFVIHWYNHPDLDHSLLMLMYPFSHIQQIYSRRLWTHLGKKYENSL